ncbi:hypothetical protein GHT06_010298 [Daphnia sinensis]|uniref:Uncharacterized protein n=1 Tax=Daphnia sinensis TaxID=1820382 RepID=A0AAD5PYX5_9CRUS|nr:hypothetical protein GHT06_010298 [Daphnia sinensis]
MDVSTVLSPLVTWVVIIISALYIIYRYVTASFNYFSDQGIPGPRPIPIFGNMWGIWRENLPEHDVKLVKKYGKIFGYYDGSKPNLWITDVDLIKAVCIKDFDHFVDRRSVNLTIKVMRKWMILMKGQGWRDIRSSVTPAFTPSKIKLRRYCRVRIENCFLSVHFFISEYLFTVVFPNFLSTFGSLGEKLYVIDDFKFIFRLLENVILERSQSKKKYNDFIEIANESISEFKKEIDSKTSTLFMLAAFDTTSTTLTNTCFQLARNPDIQEKLYDIGEVSHDMVQDMPYLEMVIQEVLRLYPPLLRVERQCTKDYSYDNGRIHFKKGQLVTVPAYALHRMEEYYPDPEKFDPDRWSPENKAKRSPYTFMAFGLGPRNCVGMRFAMEEMKIAIATMIQKFRFFPVKETPLRFFDGFCILLQHFDATVGVELRQSIPTDRYDLLLHLRRRIFKN